MNKNIALETAGAIFAIVALLHLMRLITGFEIIVSGKPLPTWPNVVGLLVAGGLSAWMFAAALRKRLSR